VVEDLKPEHVVRKAGAALDDDGRIRPRTNSRWARDRALAG